MSRLKELKEYLSSSFMSSKYFMSTVCDQIRYIYEPVCSTISAFDEKTYAANLIGIYVTGTFYSLSQEYNTIGKDYIQELYEFEQHYNDVFDKQLKRYSAKKPIGGKIAMSVELKLKQFERDKLQIMASDLIFGNIEMQNKPIDHSYFEPLFLRYLLLGSKSVEDAVRADINEHADELNYMLISEDIAYKRAAKMLREPETLNKIPLYSKIKQSDAPNFVVSVGFEGAVINNINIENEQLLRMIKNDESFTYKDKLIINFADIIEIKFGDETIYTV